MKTKSLDILGYYDDMDNGCYLELKGEFNGQVECESFTLITSNGLVIEGIKNEDSYYWQLREISNPQKIYYKEVFSHYFVVCYTEMEWILVFTKDQKYMFTKESNL